MVIHLVLKKKNREVITFIRLLVFSLLLFKLFLVVSLIGLKDIIRILYVLKRVKQHFVVVICKEKKYCS